MNIFKNSIRFVFLAAFVASFVSFAAPTAYAQQDTIGANGCALCGGYGSTFTPAYDSTYTPGYDSTYYPSYDSTYTPSYDSTYTPSYDSTYTPSYDSTYTPSYSSTYTPSYDSTYYPSYDSTYYPSYDNTYYPSYHYSYSTPPSYNPPVQVTNPIYYPVFQQQQQQQQQQQLVTSHTSNNTCTNNSCNSIKNIDNSINGSFNTNGNTITTIAQVVPVQQTPVQYPVQYTYPQQNLYCTITASPNSITNGQSTWLAWTSSGATSAWLSDGIGNVATNGSLTVRPNISKSYTLTVSGQGGTQTCTTYVSVSGNYPYVSLTQIPYTGFDFGTYGNAVYWAGLLSFALAAAYLVIYYKGGAGAFIGGMAGLRSVKSSVSVRKTSSQLSTPAIFSNSAQGGSASGRTAVKEVSTRASFENLPIDSRHSGEGKVAQTLGAPKDSMSLVHSKHGEAPRIVITRA